MIRRNALKTLVSLTALGFLMLRHPHKSFAGSSGDSDGNHSGGGSSGDSGYSRDSDTNSFSGGSSSKNSDDGYESSYGNDYETSDSNSSNGYSSSRNSGKSNSLSQFGSKSYLSGSISNDMESKNELISEIKQLLESDGLDTVTLENLKSVLETFN